jgi:hypothetical protein
VKGVIITWLIAEGIIITRSVKVSHEPPIPGRLLATSGLFVLLAILAEAPGAAGLATMIGAGLDIAGLMHLFGLGGPKPGGGPAGGGILPTPTGRTRPNITGSTGQA